MKLLIDPEIFFYGRCGMVRYYSRLFNELEKLGCKLDIPLYLSGSDMIAGSYERLKILVNRMPYGRKRTVRYFERRSKKAYYKKISEGDYDLLFITSPVFEDKFPDFLPAEKPFVMVVHDTMQCVLGVDSFFDPAGNNGDKLAYLIRKAAMTICISDTVQNDVIQLSGVDGNRTRVIHTGNLLSLTQERKPEVALPEEYILFVGERSGRKNFRPFIHSIAALLKANPKLSVVCTGTCTVWEKDLFNFLGIEQQLVFVPATDAVLVYLYKNARCLVYPSLYEGYGLPVLEAMSLGCPVLTSDRGAIPEVGGDAVYYVNPEDRKSMNDGLLEILGNAGLVKTMTTSGLKRAELFPVERMAAQFLSSLTEVLSPFSELN